MGKRIMCIVAVILAGILVFPRLSVSASGGEATLTENDNLDVDVYAKAIYNWPENCYVAEVENGSYKAQMDDGTVITVTSENLDASLRLVVYSIISDDAEAYAWIMDCTEGLGSERLPYEIYFIDESGNRVELGNVSVSITLPNGYGTASVYQVASSGTVSLLSSTTEDNSISFTAWENGFYVISFASEQDTAQSSTENNEESETTENGTNLDSDSQTETNIIDETGDTGSTNINADNTENDDESNDTGSGGQAKTGDAPIGAWIVLLLLSVADVFILLVNRRRV